MEIKRLAATFGKLEQEQLELSPGLNLIEAPNESGKSTWTAFLRVMLYGLNTRDRSPNADKRRYLPWSGSAMEGVLEAATDLGDITLLRRTARANSPMGAFSAVYTGTAQAVTDLSAASCGETLLGVPQDVFERSAYIRQTGLAVEQSKALEQRITSLVTTGEEDTSFTGAADQLRRQLNARRHNKTGLLPQVEEEQRAIRATLEQMEDLTAAAARSRQALEDLRPQVEEVENLLARHDAADQADELRKVESARLDAVSARDRARTLESNSRSLPSRPELEALQGRVEALSSINNAVDSARSRLDLSNHNLRQAAKALNAHAFAGLTPAEAASAPLDAGPRPALPRWALPAAVASGVLLTGGAALLYFTLRLLPAAIALGILGLLVLAAVPLLLLALRRRRQKWEANRAELEQQREAAVAEYTPLYEAEAEARAKQQAAQAAWEAVSASAATNLESILTQLRSFRPLVRDLPEACEALNDAFLLRGKLEQAQRREDEARHRWEALRDAAPPLPSVLAQRPDVPREQLRLRLSQLQSQDAVAALALALVARAHFIQNPLDFLQNLQPAVRVAHLGVQRPVADVQVGAADLGEALDQRALAGADIALGVIAVRPVDVEAYLIQALAGVARGVDVGNIVSCHGNAGLGGINRQPGLREGAKGTNAHIDILLILSLLVRLGNPFSWTEAGRCFPAPCRSRVPPARRREGRPSAQ